MLRQLPEDLPLFGAFIFALSFAAFGFAGMFAELALGRPSSTSSLGFFFVPIWAALVAVPGLVLGFIVRAVWRRMKGDDAESHASALLAILAFAVVASAGAGVLTVVQSEQEAKPRIRFDGGLLVREFRADSELLVRASTALYDSDNDSDRKAEVLSWGSNRSELLIADDSVVLRDTVSGKSAQFRTPALDYITRVDAVPMLAARGPSLLAIVVSGRATGRRAIIAVVDENYEVVYEEQVERFWSLCDTPIEVRVGPAKDEYAVVGGRCSNESLMLRRKNAA
jgi:hypothetical protein